MVLRKMTAAFKFYFRRSCKCKTGYSLIKALYKTFFVLKKEKLTIYKCRFCNKFHIGHKNNKTKKVIRYINRIPNLTLLDRN